MRTGVDLFAGYTDSRLGPGLRWLNEPPDWHVDGGVLTIAPAAGTDFFRPAGAPSFDNAGLLHTEAVGDFTVVTQASAHLVGFGDAAGGYRARQPGSVGQTVRRAEPCGRGLDRLRSDRPLVR